MILCNHTDLDYKRACFEAYNRWIAEYCSAHPDRLLGLGQTAVRTPEEGIADLHTIKALGLRGVMLPGEPGVEDYDSTIYDDVLGDGDRARAAALVPHPHHEGREDARPEDGRVPEHRAGLPGRDGDARDGRRVRAPSRICRSCAPRPTRAGCRTSCTGWTTRTSATVTGCPRARSSRSCRASTSPTTSSSRSRTTGPRSSTPTT